MMYNKEIRKVLNLMERVDNSFKLEVINEITKSELQVKLNKGKDDGEEGYLKDEYLNYIFGIDPFTQGKNVGRLSVWFFSLPNFRDIDLEGLETYFRYYYEAAKSNKLPDALKNLQRFKTMDDFINKMDNLINEYDGDFKSKSDKKRNIKNNDIIKFYEDNNWLVVIPKTEEASCYYGKGTKWCTAGKEDNKFEEYNDDGYLYIIIDKNNKDYDGNQIKYQLHLERKELNNDKNKVVNIYDINLPNELLNKFPKNNMFKIFGNIFVMLPTFQNEYDEYEGEIIIYDNENGKKYTVSTHTSGIVFNSNKERVDYIHYINFNNSVKEFILSNSIFYSKKINELIEEKYVYIHTNNIDGNESNYYQYLSHIDVKTQSIINIDLFNGEYELIDVYNDVKQSGFIFNSKLFSQNIIDVFLQESEDFIEEVDGIYLDDSRDKYYYVENGILYIYNIDDGIFMNEKHHNIDPKNIPSKFIDYINDYYGDEW